MTVAFFHAFPTMPGRREACISLNAQMPSWHHCLWMQVELLSCHLRLSCPQPFSWSCQVSQRQHPPWLGSNHSRVRRPTVQCPSTDFPHFQPTPPSCGPLFREHLSLSTSDPHSSSMAQLTRLLPPSFLQSPSSGRRFLPKPLSPTQHLRVCYPCRLQLVPGRFLAPDPTCAFPYVPATKPRCCGRGASLLPGWTGQGVGLDTAVAVQAGPALGITRVLPPSGTHQPSGGAHTLPVPAQTCWTCLTSSGAAHRWPHIPPRRWSGRRWHQCQPWAHFP